MDRHIIRTAASLLLIIGSASAGAWATDGPPCGIETGFHGEGMPMMPPPMGPPFMERMKGVPEHPLWRRLMDLGLDMQQKESIKEIKSRTMKEMIRNRADGHIAGIELRELLDKDTVDMKAVEMKLRQIETVNTAMHHAFIRAIEDVKSKLTPEQRIKFKEMIGIGPDTGFPPPMMEGMMHGGMKMPPPPCEKKEEMRKELEHMPNKVK
jgi:Spy/CpxP family protein refolding chaperone